MILKSCWTAAENMLRHTGGLLAQRTYRKELAIDLEMCMFHWARLVGVGSYDNCPAGRPNMRHFHSGVESSRLVASCNFKILLHLHVGRSFLWLEWEVYEGSLSLSFVRQLRSYIGAVVEN